MNTDFDFSSLLSYLLLRPREEERRPLNLVVIAADRTKAETNWELSAKRPVAISVLVTSSHSLASHANDCRGRSATPVAQRQRNGPLLFAAKDGALCLPRWRRGFRRICLPRFVRLQPRTPDWR
jgi:hypothetical protein